MYSKDKLPEIVIKKLFEKKVLADILTKNKNWKNQVSGLLSTQKEEKREEVTNNATLWSLRPWTQMQ